MIVRRNHLTLLLLNIATVTAGPAAVAHRTLNASLLNTHTGPSDGGSENTRPDAQAFYQSHGPPFSVAQEAIHGAMPPPLWHVLFEEHLDLRLRSNDDYKIRAESQQQRNWLQTLVPFYLPNTKNVSNNCRRDVKAISSGIVNQTQWALRMVDSWGKFTDGVLAGNAMVMGLLDECLMLSVDQYSPQPRAEFKGQYCAFSVSMKPKSTSARWTDLEEGDEEEEGEEEEEDEERVKVLVPGLRMGNVKGLLQVAIPFNLLSTCIPSTCTKEEYGDSLREAMGKRNLQLTLLECQTKDLPTLQNNPATIIMIITLVLMGFMVLVGTITDVWILVSKNENLAKGPMRFFLVFSFYTNLSKIFRINVNESEEVISCLHGMRVLSMCWVVMGHDYLLSLVNGANKGLIADYVKENPYFYQIILNAYPSVDTFFFITGLLVAYNLTKEFQRTSRFNVPLYYIHRFVRLAPPILLLCGFFAVFPPLFVQGSLSPMLTEKGNLVESCIRYWWRDSFFVTNYFMDNPTCIPVCWYTAVEFQLYIVTPLMFLPILYRRKAGAAILGAFLLVSIIVPMVIIGTHRLPPSNVLDATGEDMKNTESYVYMKPWCRATPYLVGLALGYYLRVVNKKVQLTWWQVLLGWIVALAVMAAVVFGLKDFNTLTGPKEFSAATSILYGGLHRLGWGMAMAWMVFACHMGYGGPINSFLAHPFWQPSSRLTYAIFLIAFNVQSLYYMYYSRLPLYFTPFNKLMETTGILLISAMGAVLLSLLAESPVLGLEKLLLKKSK